MKKMIVSLFVVTVLSPRSSAQDYLTLTSGLSTMFHRSEDLNRFKDTYNLVNGQNLYQPMQGFGAPAGLCWEIGYRRLKRWDTAVLTGYQTYTASDKAEYNDGARRNLKCTISSLYVGAEVGRTFGHFFVNGVSTVFFNRKLRIESTYSGALGVKTPEKSLDGTYESGTSLSADIGIAAGFFKKPVFIIAKITYPVYTGGKSFVLRDNRSEKAADGTDVFPDDYVSYYYGDPYEGIHTNIDGLKITVSAAIAFRLKKWMK